MQQECEVANHVLSAVREQRADRKSSIPQGPPPRKPLALARLRLKVHNLSKQEPPIGDQRFRHMSLRETFHIQTTSVAKGLRNANVASKKRPPIPQWAWLTVVFTSLSSLLLWIHHVERGSLTTPSVCYTILTPG